MNSNAFIKMAASDFFCIGNIQPNRTATPFLGLIDCFCIHSRTLNVQGVEWLINQNADGDSQINYLELIGGVKSPYVFDP